MNVSPFYILGRAAANVRGENEESLSVTTRAPSHPTTGECGVTREVGSRIQVGVSPHGHRAGIFGIQ